MFCVYVGESHTYSSLLHNFRLLSFCLIFCFTVASTFFPSHTKSAPNTHENVFSNEQMAKNVQMVCTLHITAAKNLYINRNNLINSLSFSTPFLRQNNCNYSLHMHTALMQCVSRVCVYVWVWFFICHFCLCFICNVLGARKQLSVNGTHKKDSGEWEKWNKA